MQYSLLGSSVVIFWDTILTEVGDIEILRTRVLVWTFDSADLKGIEMKYFQ